MKKLQLQKLKKKRQKPNLAILGIDEVGRGPWAGPLVVGACVLGDAQIEGLTDSKKLTPKKREALAAEETLSQGEEEPKVAFEDENGVPENKILTGVPDSKPTLRPTAKERITSAMQNLSDVLRAPRGLSRERTMKIRAQSRNLTGNPNLKAQSPLEVTRFDRESNEKVKILQMSRRGFPASAIASSLKISQEKVEAVIKEAMG